MQKTIDIPIVGAPQKLAYQFFELRLNDWLVLIAGLLGAVIANKYLSLPGMIAVLVLTGYVLFPLINDRRYVVWIMRLYGKLWLSGVLRGQLWPVDPEQMSGWRKLVVRMFIPPNAYPFQVDRLFNIGLNYNRSKLTDSVVVVGGGSRFASLSPAAKHDMQMKLATEMQKLAKIKGMKARVSLSMRRRPLDISAILVQQNEHMLASAYLPKAIFVLKQRQMPLNHESVEQLYDNGVLTDDDVIDWNHYVLAHSARQEAPKYCREPDYVAVLTVVRSRRLRDATRDPGRKLEESEVFGEQLVSLAEEFQRRLRAIQVTNPTILSQEELEDFNRAGWDVAEIDAYRMKRLAGEKVQHHPERRICVQNGLLVFDDSSYHSVLRITGLPDGIEPDDFGALFSRLPTRGFLTLTEVSEVVTGSSEYNVLNYLINVVDDIMSVMGILRPGARTRRRREALQELSEKIDEQRHVTYFSILVGIASTSPEDVRADVKTVMDAISELNASCQQEVHIEWLPRVVFSALLATALV